MCWIEGCESSNRFLASAEGDDAADGIVRRDADSDAVPGHNLDAEPSHAAAQLRENFVSLVARDAIQAPAVDSHYGALHVDQIVLAQKLSFLQRLCHIGARRYKLISRFRRDPSRPVQSGP